MNGDQNAGEVEEDPANFQPFPLDQLINKTASELPAAVKPNQREVRIRSVWVDTHLHKNTSSGVLDLKGTFT